MWPFTKKKTDVTKVMKQVPLRTLYNVEHFNKWLCESYKGYGGYPGGAAGIFLRLDKLSYIMIKDYFIAMGYGDLPSNVQLEFYNDVCIDWREQKNKK